MARSPHIIRVDASTTSIFLALDKGCHTAQLSAATLRIQRAGCWPVQRTVVETVETECGPRNVLVYEDYSPPVITLTAQGVTPDWEAEFVPSEAWLAEPDGRYDADFITACGTVCVRFQKGAPTRSRQAQADISECSDIGATCQPVCPSGPLSLPVVDVSGVWRIYGHPDYANNSILFSQQVARVAHGRR